MSAGRLLPQKRSRGKGTALQVHEAEIMAYGVEEIALRGEEALIELAGYLPGAMDGTGDRDSARVLVSR